MTKIFNSIGFIGGGNMASAIIKGITTRGIVHNDRVFVYDIAEDRVNSLIKDCGVSAAASNKQLVESCSIIFLSVKPNVISVVLDEIRDYLTPNHLIISIAAGISMQYIEEKVNNSCKVLRTMPNTPALVGEGMTVLCKSNKLDNSDLQIAREIFSSLGKVEEVDEKLMDAVTALSGSSPAYVYLFIEAMTDGGVLMGLPRELSYRLASQAVLGSAKMVMDSNMHPGALKDIVCSPGGTTIEAVYTLEKNGFRGAVMDAVRACADKSEKLGKVK